MRSLLRLPFQRAVTCVLLGSVLAASLPPGAGPASGRQGEAKTIREDLPASVHSKWDTALVLFGAGNWGAARTEFLDVYNESKNPRVLFNVAICEKNTGQYARAIATLSGELAEAAGGQARSDRGDPGEGHRGRPQDVRRRGAHHCVQPGAKVFVDDVEVGVSPLPPQRVGIGERHFAAKKPASSTPRPSARPAGQKPEPIRLKLEAVASSPPSPCR
ncbi:MAG: hypothetical protein IPQ09_23080 [Myxococcales bacterium]|nr:hypothetical protein [Myxococcales bacterium]